MKLLIDAGNSRLKWQLQEQGGIVEQGACLQDTPEWLDQLSRFSSRISRIAVSTVISEAGRDRLVENLGKISSADVAFYWSEAKRAGLVNSYSDFSRLGADRWHAMYGAWRQKLTGFAVIDAGSAITIDYVADDGAHLGGYILPGKQMMLRSLSQDAARIGFEASGAISGEPGRSTSECVHHGVVWLWEGLVKRLSADLRRHGLSRVLCTGGDAAALIRAGLPGEHHADLVFEGLNAIYSESAG